MSRFSNISIRNKLTTIIMGTTAAALLIACASFLVYEYIAVPRTVAKNLSTLALVMGNNSTAAMVFNDENAASETLGALRATPNVIWGYIYKKDGRVFASYARNGANKTAPPCHSELENYRVIDGRVEICRVISLQGETLGTISLVSDLAEMKERMWGYGKIVVVVMVISLIVAFIISTILQRVISVPILSLANLARQISAQQNYSIRASKQSEDELGVLVDGFNGMLTQIENRDLALQKAHTQLEDRIAELQREVAERKRAEKNLAEKTTELQRSNAELQQFAYVASHDLQEPLRMVSSYTQLLLKRYRDKLDETAHEFVNFAVDGVKRMQTLIHDLLEFSRVGTRSKPFEPVICESMVQESLLNLSASIGECNAVITRDPLPTVMADDSQLVQLFQNLISNAIKYRSHEAPKVHVGCRKQNDGWLFSVTDNGIGMESQYAERVFVIFQRLHTKEEYPGNGIGLAICKKIVERHGGSIWVESEVKKGSTFYFTLPEGLEAGPQDDESRP